MLAQYVAYWTANPPTADWTLDISGTIFPYPNDGVSNTYLLQLDVLFDVQAHVFTSILNE